MSTGRDALDEAQALQALMRQDGLSQAELARQLGRPQGQISKRLALLTLSPRLRDQVAAGRLAVSGAGLIARAVKEAGPMLGALVDEVVAERDETGLRGEEILAEAANQYTARYPDKPPVRLPQMPRAVAPPAPHPTAQLGVHVPVDVIDRARRTVTAMQNHDPRYTLTRLVGDALTTHVERLEATHNQGRPFPKAAGLRPGRPPSNRSAATTGLARGQYEDERSR